MSRISTAVQFPGAQRRATGGAPRPAGRAGAARVCAVRALLHVLEGHQGDDAHRRSAGRRRARHAALRLHRAGRLGRRIREHRFLVERRRPGGGRPLARNPSTARRRCSSATVSAARRCLRRPRRFRPRPRWRRSTRRPIPRISASSSTDSEDEIRAKGAAQVELAGRHFTIRREFLDDIAAQNVVRAVAGLKRALLVMHAPADAIVSVDHASAIFLAARHPKSFVSLDTADHLLTRREDARYAAHGAGGVGKPLPAGDADDAAPNPTVRATPCSSPKRGQGKFQQQVAIGPHRLHRRRTGRRRRHGQRSDALRSRGSPDSARARR